jgi:hypothetical protein
MQKRGTEEPGDQIVARAPDGGDADASSADATRHTLDGQANVAGGRWPDAGPADPTAGGGDRDASDG